jgi:hypothetical protein
MSAPRLGSAIAAGNKAPLLTTKAFDRWRQMQVRYGSANFVKSAFTIGFRGMAEGRGGSSPSNVRNLTDAIRKVRIAEADRSDGFVDLQEAERARLEMLADELRDVFADVPADDDQFIFTVSTGTQPRLWIDMTAFVIVARDRRTYRFLKDTRLGRTVILESPSIDDVADTITNYVAERIIEKERALEGDWLSRRIRQDAKRRPEPLGERPPVPEIPRRRRLFEGRSAGWVVAGFLGGILIGVLGLLAYAWITVPL